MKFKIFFYTGILLLAACGAPSAEKDGATPLENGLSTQLDAVEKAKGVEQSMQEAAKQRAREIDQKGG